MDLDLRMIVTHPSAVSESFDILKGVSRSFYLSIRILPAPMRQPIALAYLLARASDTMADTAGIDPKIRLRALELFSECVVEESGSEALMSVIKEQLIPQTEHVSERRLLKHLAPILQELEHYASPLRECIKKVVDTIISGQILDVNRFECELGRIETEAELDDYCYKVAGCVGEFWTEVGCLTVDNFSTLPSEELLELGRSFGKGLQLINIMRDAPEDVEQGRSYLPNMEMLEKAELAPWIEQARASMEDGLRYTDSLQSRRCRLATYLPAAIGLDTLDGLENASEQQWKEGVKIKRTQVYQALLEGLVR